MKRWRLAIGSAGILLGLFGMFRLLTQVPLADLIVLAIWLAGAVVIHDGIVSPLVIGIGWAVSSVVPPRARQYLQGGLIPGALVTIIAIPMIFRRGSQPASKAILQQNYFGNLTLLLAILATISLVAYAIHVSNDHRNRSDVADPPSEV